MQKLTNLTLEATTDLKIKNIAVWDIFTVYLNVNLETLVNC